MKQLLLIFTIFITGLAYSQRGYGCDVYHAVSGNYVLVHEEITGIQVYQNGHFGEEKDFDYTLLEKFKEKECVKLMDFKEFPEQIRAFSNLRYLELYNTQFTELPEWFDELNLEVFIWEKGDLTEVPKALYSQTESLKYLSLSGHQITRIPSEIMQFRNLEVLKFGTIDRKGEDNVYIGNPISEIPAELIRLDSLKWLEMEGTNITEIPDWFLDLKNLEVLCIGGTKVKYLPYNPLAYHGVRIYLDASMKFDDATNAKVKLWKKKKRIEAGDRYYNQYKITTGGKKAKRINIWA